MMEFLILVMFAIVTAQLSLVCYILLKVANIFYKQEKVHTKNK